MGSIPQQSNNSIEELDVAVLGAGLSGISFARFYLDTHPNSKLAIFEKESEIGGTWGRSRTFDTFWTQSALRLTSFSDVPLVLPEGAPILHDSFPAKYVTDYIEDYVCSHVYNGKSLADRIELNKEIESITKLADGWLLSPLDHTTAKTRCKMLAVASGLTSQPNKPLIPTNAGWKPPSLHHRDFGLRLKQILAETSPYKHITILGGGKSSADMVYACLKSGKQINWVTRKSGEGPGYLVSPAPVGKYRSAAEIPFTRQSSKLNPSGFCPLASDAQQMHTSEEGRAKLTELLKGADLKFKSWANYNGRENALANFHKLEPTTSLFWASGPPGMMQHDDFWDLVGERVSAYRSDITSATEDFLVLEDGSTVRTDLLLAGTGWDAGYSFLTAAQVCDLGLPHDVADDSAEESRVWQQLLSAADARIVKEYPILAHPPEETRVWAVKRQTPARLYQGIAPLNDDSIVFLGRARMSNGFLRAEAQSIWATAFFDGRVKMVSAEEAREKVAYMNAFSRRRYPYDHDGDGVNFVKDIVWYTDRLLVEAGVTSHRRLWWEDETEPLVLSDLEGCAREYTESLNGP